jgi:hypothetical protein
MANIARQLKESQEQIARLVASQRTQRPKTLATSPLPIAASMRKRLPTTPSPQVRVQTQQWAAMARRVTRYRAHGAPRRLLYPLFSA